MVGLLVLVSETSAHNAQNDHRMNRVHASVVGNFPGSLTRAWLQAKKHNRCMFATDRKYFWGGKRSTGKF